MSHSSAVKGTRITIELDPRSGFELDRLTVTNLDTGRKVSLTERYSDEYTFTMPASDVEIELSYSDERGGGYYPTNKPPVSAKPIRWYYKDGHIYHVTDGLVPAGSPLTRDMLISVLYNMDDNSSGDPAFWASNHNIVPNIYESVLWGVDKPINREQTAMILYCYAQYKGYNTSQTSGITHYADFGQIRPIAQPAMAWAHASGVVPGTSDSTLSPRSGLICEEANGVITRFLSVVVRRQ